MARTFSSSFAAATLIAATPFALHAQQEAGQGRDASQNQQANVHAFVVGANDQSDVRVINIKVDPARSDSLAKAEKAKNDRNKKKGVKSKISSSGLQSEDRDESQGQTWETEFLVDHAQDHTTDPVPPAAQK